jgi:hypothetical protein
VGENPRNKGFENSCQVALKNSLVTTNVSISLHSASTWEHERTYYTSLLSYYAEDLGSQIRCNSLHRWKNYKRIQYDIQTISIIEGYTLCRGFPQTLVVISVFYGT